MRLLEQLRRTLIRHSNGNPRRKHRARLLLESLEARETPSASGFDDSGAAMVAVAGFDDSGDDLSEDIKQRLGELRREHGFHFEDSYYEDWAGKGEKWFKDRHDDWYFVTPDGTIRKWNPEVEIEDSEIIERFDDRIHKNPEYLFNAAVPLSDDAAEALGKLRGGHGFHFEDSYYENWAGKGERWFQDRNEDWYYITPDGTIFEWDPEKGLDDQPVVAQVDPIVYDEPVRLFNSDVKLDPEMETEIRDLKDDHGFHYSGSYYENWLGQHEKWFQDRHDDWYYITRDGTVRKWEPGHAFEDHTIVASLDPVVYDDPEILLEAPYTLTGDDLALLQQLDDDRGFHYSGSYYENWFGQHEKWFQDGDDDWYYITPDGTVYEWNPAAGPDAQPIFAQLDSAVFDDTDLLLMASVSDQSQRIRLEGRLLATSAAPLASGKAKFEVRSDRVKFSAESEDIAPGTAVDVFLRRDGEEIHLGSAVADGFGVADLNLDSRLGHQIPDMVVGDVIEVRSNGQAILRGTLAGKQTAGDDGNRIGDDNPGGIDDNPGGIDDGNQNGGNVGEVLIEGNLVGTSAAPLASGKAKFEVRADRTKFSAETEDITPGTVVDVFAIHNGQALFLGSATADAFGVADLNLDSRLGHQVPALAAGDIIEVRTGGITIARGTLGGTTAALPIDDNPGGIDDNPGGIDDGNTGGNNQVGELRLEGGLIATAAAPLASGKAKFEVRDDRIKFSTEVEDMPTGATIEVVAVRGGNTISIGSITTDGFGFADLNLDSRLGDTVPLLQAGDVIQVWLGSQMLLSGILG